MIASFEIAVAISVAKNDIRWFKNLKTIIFEWGRCRHMLYHMLGPSPLGFTLTYHNTEVRISKV